MAVAKRKRRKVVMVPQEVEVEEKRRLEYSKQLVTDIRSLLWVITVGGIVLAFYAVHKSYLGALPWITTMVGLPWSAHGVVCAFYLNMSKSDHRRGGITYEAAAADNFGVTAVQETTYAAEDAVNSPGI